MQLLASLLGKCGLRYCVLHGWRSTPGNLESDVDLAVAANDLGRLEAVFRNAEGAQLVQLFQHETSCYYFVLAIRSGGTVQFVTLDVATDYRRDGVVFLTEQDLLARREDADGVWVAGAPTEFRYLLVKKILKGALPDHQKMRVRALFSSLGEEAHAVVYRMMGARWGSRVVDWLARSDWVAFEAHLPGLKNALWWETVKRDPFNPIRYWLPELWRRWRRAVHPTGLCVAVLGPDGAGKSTLADRLVRDLSGAFRHTEVVHLRPRLVKSEAPGRPVTDPHGKAPYGAWRSLLKLLYYTGAHAAGHVLKVRPRLTRSSLVIFNRYYHDLLVDPLRYRYGGPMLLASLMGRIIPAPDLWLILDVPEDELGRRKQEVSRAEVRRQRQGYRHLASDLPRAFLLDGSLAPDEVVRSAREVVLGYLRRRYERRRGLWFGMDGRRVHALHEPAGAGSVDR
jgi:thymidylate kinase